MKRWASEVIVDLLHAYELPYAALEGNDLHPDGLSRALDRVLERTHTEATLRGFLRNIAYAAMVVIVIRAAMSGASPPSCRAST